MLPSSSIVIEEIPLPLTPDVPEVPSSPEVPDVPDVPSSGAVVFSYLPETELYEK